jgi:peptide chain release factor 2
MTDELQLAYEFYKEGELSVEELDEQYNGTEKHIEAIEFKNMLSDEGDSLSAVLQITAGAGGTESCDWASMLMRMYMMWAEKSGYKLRELNYQEGDAAGIKTVTLEIEGDYAFGYLKGENGVHRF